VRLPRRNRFRTSHPMGTRFFSPNFYPSTSVSPCPPATVDNNIMRVSPRPDTFPLISHVCVFKFLRTRFSLCECTRIFILFFFLSFVSQQVLVAPQTMRTVSSIKRRHPIARRRTRGKKTRNVVVVVVGGGRYTFWGRKPFFFYIYI